MDRHALPYTVEDGIQHFEAGFPSAAHAEFLCKVFAPPLTRDQIYSRFGTSVQAYLRSQPRQQSKGLVIVEDDTRPSRLGPILEPVLDCLHEEGWRTQEISFLVAAGAHGPSGGAALGWKLGERILADYAVVQHVATACLPTGISFGDRELMLNPLFLKSDWVILVGSCLPHPFAGFGGGIKLVVPGIASLEDVVASHKLAFLRGRPGSLVEDCPPYRALIHELVRSLRPMLSIACLVNYGGEVVDLYAGNPVTSYWDAVNAAKSLYSLSPPIQSCDILLLNCYPKDRDLIQCKNSLLFHARHGKGWLKENGLVILAAPGVRRIGVHHVLGPGGRLYQRPGKIRSLGSHRLWFYAPHLPKAEYRAVFSEDYPLFNSWSRLLEGLEEEFSSDYSVAIVPAAALHC